jgi:hypothetical protein
MPETFHGWIHRHFNVVLSFVIGMTLGISILALAYFSTRNDGEDMAWFFCGIVVGASVTCLSWWRDSKAESVGLEKGDVLNRLIKDPSPPIGRGPE